ncbi:MAG TPA: hypothetical protein DCX89_02305, partial [Saprospirales bacterium]|nr:hypothetical protein [Saprospirales bacterium]HRQ28861.1 FtsL-like putative cell division protein [Saprospiraceae bacterium]
LSLIVFLAVLALVYISNVHVAERKQLKIEEKKREVQKIKWEYMSVEKDMLLNSSPSEMEKKTSEIGLQPPSSIPSKLTLKNDVEK